MDMNDLVGKAKDLADEHGDVVKAKLPDVGEAVKGADGGLMDKAKAGLGALQGDSDDASDEGEKDKDSN